MTTFLKELRNRFSRPEVAAEPRRRRDFKGPRGRLGLRVSKVLLADLDVLVLATGIDRNSFCEEVLREAVSARLAEERERFGDHGWGVLERCAKGDHEKTD